MPQTSPPQSRYPDLDYRFLQYIGVTVDGEEVTHGVYVPMFAGCRKVVDLGCGLGGFVKMLRAHGIDAYGVDADPQCVTDATAHNIPVVLDDVISHLRTLDAETIDGVFSAHLVEHLPYEVVLELIKLAFRALKPGGRLVLATPNPRALVSHLELYTMHFGHVAMYHPNLLAFFMTYSGFVDVVQGDNLATNASAVAGSSPLASLDQILADLRAAPQSVFPAQSTHVPATEILPKPANPLRRAIWYAKMGLIKWLVQPYYDHLNTQIAAQSAAISQSQAYSAAQLSDVRQALVHLIESVHRPFESYVLGVKPNS